MNSFWVSNIKRGKVVGKTDLWDPLKVSEADACEYSP